MKVKLTWLLLLLLLQSLSANEVDTLNMLFPEMQSNGRHVPAQLIASKDGCYKWSSTSPELVTVEHYQTQHNLCSSKGFVKLHHQGPYSSSIYITAQDQKTEELLNIPLRIRKLHKISIFTKSRMMNIREVQKIQIYGFDQENNTFTSLEGLRFQWTLLQNQKIITKVAIEDAQLYLPLNIRQQIEKNGEESDILVLKALIPGNLIVRCRCIEEGYKDIMDEITISVHERFDIVPMRVTRMFVSAEFQFKLQRPVGEIIALPQPYYKHSFTGNSQGIALGLNESLYFKGPSSALNLTMKVEDTRTKPPYSSQTMIEIYEPDSIQLQMAAFMVVGNTLTFNVQLYYKQFKLQGFSSDIVVKSDFSYSAGNSYIKCENKKIGKVTAMFKGLKVEKIISCYLPIKVLLLSNQIHLPVHQEYQLQVIGGSGEYVYTLENKESEKQPIFTTSPKGHIFAKEEGSDKLIIADKFDPSNKAVILVTVSSPATIYSIEKTPQSNAYEFGKIFMVGLSSNNKKYTQCYSLSMKLDNMKYKFEISAKNTSEHIKSLKQSLAQHSFQNGAIDYLEQSLLEEALFPKYYEAKLLQEYAESQYSLYLEDGDMNGLVKMLAMQQNYGICHVIQYKYWTALDEVISIMGKAIKQHSLESTVKMRVYERLASVIQPNKNKQFILTPGAGLTWITAGGSYPWKQSQTLIRVNQVKQTHNHPYLECGKTPSNHVYTLKYQNKQTQTLLFPAVQEINIQLKCKFPTNLILKTHEFEAAATVIQTFETDAVVFIYPNTLLHGILIPLDEGGHTYYNSSNLFYQMDTANHVGYVNSFVDQRFAYQLRNVTAPQIATLSFYTKALKDKTSFVKVSVSLELNFIKPFLIWPDFATTNLLIPFSPEKHYKFPIQNGNDYLTIECNALVLNCLISKDDKNAVISIKNDGVSSVSVQDPRVYGSTGNRMQIQVARIDDIKVRSNRESIAVNRNVNISIILLSKNREIDAVYYDSYALRLIYPQEVYALRLIAQDQNIYQMKGLKEGHYTIQAEYAQFDDSNHKMHLRSKQHPQLEVYSQIQINLQSHSVTILENQLVESHFQTNVLQHCSRVIRFRGGPKGLTIISEHPPHTPFHVQKLSAFAYSVSLEKTGVVSENPLELRFNAIHKNKIIAAFHINFTLNAIDHLRLLGHQQIIKKSQVRFKPEMSVDSWGSFCEFQFQWSVDPTAVISVGRSSGGYLIEAGGVNVSAARVGKAVLKLKILHDEVVIATASTEVQVVEDNSLAFPTLIGQPPQTNNYLLMPPNSGYGFEKSYKITSSCAEDETLLTIEQSRVSTSKKMGSRAIALKDKDNDLTTYCTVIITEIASIFIENEDGNVLLERNEVRKVKMYLLDQYGRVFPSGLDNIEFKIMIDNDQIVNAAVSPAQDQLWITALDQGSAVIRVELVGRNAQFDAINVRVGVLIEPISPITVMKGGVIRFTFKDSSSDSGWTSSNTSIIEINEHSGLSWAKEVGKAYVQINSIKSEVTVIDSLIIQEAVYKDDIFLERPTVANQFAFKVFGTCSTTSLVSSTMNCSPINLHSDASQIINNNVELGCRILHHSKYFHFQSKVSSVNNQSNVFSCLIYVKDNIYDSPTPIQNIQLQIFNVKTQQLYYSHHYKFYLPFFIAQSFMSVSLNKAAPTQQIIIRTTEILHLQLDTIGTKQWIKSEFIPDQLSMNLLIDMSKVEKSISFKILIQNLKSHQKSAISVRFSDYEETETKKGSGSESRSWFSVMETQFDWPDLLILVMAIIFAGLCFYQHQQR